MTYNIVHKIDDNPETNQHLSDIIESMKKDGWAGRPLLSDGDQLLTGSHRYTASKIVGIEPEIHQVEIALDYGDDDDWMLYDYADAYDDQTKHQAIKQLYVAGYIDAKSYEIIEFEATNTGR